MPGTAAGTHAVGKQVQSDSNFAVLDSIVYFGGWSDEDAKSTALVSPQFVPAPTLRLWRSDGTVPGTHSVAGSPQAHIRNVTAVGSRIFFTADTEVGTELWSYMP